ncbi:MAG TPA: DUF4390 domain-containing protein [Desulfobulbaceae bacterium]|nr:DUF4390 domain-containing protein [Desulfobulbaceae bacterium]
MKSLYSKRFPTVMKYITSIFLFVAVFLLLSSPLHAKQKKDPDLKDIIITTSDSHLLLFATVQNCFTKEMVQGVRNGLPVTFNFHIELDKVRSAWFDSTLIETIITHTLTYDSIKEQYAVIFSEKKGQLVATRSLEQAKQLMAEVNGFPLIERKLLVPDAPYALKIKATLAETTLPLGMHYILPFTSLWDFETDWRTVEFHY